MSDRHATVIVGIDGSETAIQAGLWAIDEAISRNASLRLISVMKSAHPSSDDYYTDRHHADASLRAAQAAVEATGKAVKIETEIIDGPPGTVLLEQSGDADMVVVSSLPSSANPTPESWPRSSDHTATRCSITPNRWCWLCGTEDGRSDTFTDEPIRQ